MQSYALIMLQLPTITKANVENRRDHNCTLFSSWAAVGRPTSNWVQGRALVDLHKPRAHPFVNQNICTQDFERQGACQDQSSNKRLKRLKQLKRRKRLKRLRHPQYITKLISHHILAVNRCTRTERSERDWKGMNLAKSVASTLPSSWEVSEKRLKNGPMQACQKDHIHFQHCAALESTWTQPGTSRWHMAKRYLSAAMPYCLTHQRLWKHQGLSGHAELDQDLRHHTCADAIYKWSSCEPRLKQCENPCLQTAEGEYRFVASSSDLCHPIRHLTLLVVPRTVAALALANSARLCGKLQLPSGHSLPRCVHNVYASGKRGWCVHSDQWYWRLWVLQGKGMLLAPNHWHQSFLSATPAVSCRPGLGRYWIFDARWRRGASDPRQCQAPRAEMVVRYHVLGMHQRWPVPQVFQNSSPVWPARSATREHWNGKPADLLLSVPNKLHDHNIPCEERSANHEQNQSSRSSHIEFTDFS